jgi:putative ABC transport system permease protein
MTMLRTAIDDVRHSVRRLLARPVYALITVITLALGVGGTASTYGVSRGVLFDALPYGHAGEVGVFWKKTDWTEEEFLHIRGRVPGFAQVALYRQRDMIRRDGDEAASLLPGVAASAELFDVLGVTPVLGRGFRTGDDVPGAEPVAVLGFGLWQEMGGDPSLIGRQMTLDGIPRTVIGMMPRGFWFPDPSVRIWTSAALRPTARNWNSTLVGRVAPGHDVAAMATPVAQLTAMLDERFDYPAQWDKTKDGRITPLRDDLTGAVGPALLATIGAMALILLIACANVAALMLGQVEARSVEFAVRSALGASRQRLIRPLVVEALLIAIAAGALGAALAWGGFTVVTRALPLGAWAESAAPDWRVFASAVTIAVAAALLAIVVPAAALYRGDLRGVLGRARTGGIEGRGGRLENGLVIAEVALAVLVATGAALLARSVANLYAVHPGVRTEGVAVVDVMLGERLPRARLEQTLGELTRALSALPGVRSIATAQNLPLRGGGYNLPLVVDGRPDIRGMTSEYRMVSPGYLETMGFALRQGRMLSHADRHESEPVVVINDALARAYFAGTDPIGKVIGDGEESWRVVGVVANAVERGLTDAAVPVRYVAFAQKQWIDSAQSLVLRAAPGVDETALLDLARRAIARVAPGVAVQQTTTMGRVRDTAVGPARQVVQLLSMLTALALTLGAVGIYGVIAHFAARRRRDWAIRVALGLTNGRVIAQVIGHGATLVTVGIAIGAVGAVGLTRLLSSFLYGVSAIDPIAFAAAGAALLGVGLLAAVVPAWRAGMTDPVKALREP